MKSNRPQFTRPFRWLGFSLAAVVVIAGLAVASSESGWEKHVPDAERTRPNPEANDPGRGLGRREAVHIEVRQMPWRQRGRKRPAPFAANGECTPSHARRTGMAAAARQSLARHACIWQSAREPALAAGFVPQIVVCGRQVAIIVPTPGFADFPGISRARILCNFVNKWQSSAQSLSPSTHRLAKEAS